MLDYTRDENDAAVTLNPRGSAQASIIWLHGLGADGYDFMPIVPELALPDTLAVRFIFPHAPYRSVTMNSGHVMRAWYDIEALHQQGKEDLDGIRASQQLTHGFIQQEIDKGVPLHKIVIAGFSQGGAIALQTALRYPQRLAGVLALSTYLPARHSFAQELSAANRDLPILMCHGRYDAVVPLVMGEFSSELLEAQGLKVDFRIYDMQHSVCAQEVTAISTWLQQLL